MTCPTPYIDISQVSRKRKRRQPSVNVGANVDVEVSFILDGVQEYRNLTGTNLDGKLDVKADPQITRFEPSPHTFRTIWPKPHKTVDIKVRERTSN